MIATLKTGFGRLRARPAGAPLLSPSTAKGLVSLVVLAVAVTALVLMFLWRDQASYKPVFGEREKVASGEMMAVLDAEGIAYRLHPQTGQVLVPDDALGRVRMLLAAKGVTAQLPAGLELMDRSDPLGVSQFVQDVRFRRGLEGELAQSILSIDAVESARVHLSIAKSTSFVSSDGAESSASVIVGLKPGRGLSPEQTAAIVKLVAGSVASLDPQRVSLVDQSGNLLSARIDLADGFEGGQGNEAAQHYQDEVRRNVHELLAPALGSENFRVSVTAAVDNDRIEETREVYGADPKITSEAMREEQDRNRLALGVPGSLSNRPVAVAAAASAAGEGNTAQKSATTRQYAYDRTITQIKRSRGRLQKLNLAVVLNSAVAPDPQTGWTPQEIANIERILRNGLGLVADRGDTLAVSALPFPSRTLPPQEWWQQRDNIVDIGGWVAKALALLLGFLLIVRPLLKLAQQHLAPAQPQLPAPAAESAALPAPPSAITPVTPLDAASRADAPRPMPVVPLLEDYDLPPPGSPVDVMVDHLKVLAAKEPERVAEVVKQWVQKHGRSE